LCGSSKTMGGPGGTTRITAKMYAKSVAAV
jgi:hypothetical protein